MLAWSFRNILIRLGASKRAPHTRVGMCYILDEFFPNRKPGEGVIWEPFLSYGTAPSEQSPHVPRDK